AIYLSLEKNIRKLNIYVGVRSENTKSFVHLNKSVSALIDTNYISLYPSLKFNYEKSQNLNFDLTYSRRITRPEFRQVNPEITYFDSLSYKIGNPLLVPTFSDNIDASINLYNIVTLSAGYQFKHNSIIEIAESNNNIIKYTFINLPESKMLTSSIDINYSKKWFSGNINLSVEKPHVKIKYLNSSKLLSKPTWYFSLNNDIKLFKKIVFNYSFNYQSSGNYEISYFNEKYNLSFSIYRKFIKNQLTVSLIANDVLNTDDTKWFDKYSNITSKIYPDLDYTYIRLSIKFNFNNFKSGFKENFGNSDELNRI
ncbi:MAG TPA: outer membrane beta-barrel family protein, partial [Bacteroidales bacterium]|nr:outer membrane beta-barrel family protein [Bacteroidales bacterium]